MRIGELARAAGVKAETIRYYEREGVLASPPRTQANYRDYGPEHARRLNFIRRARDLGFSMTRIRELLELADGLPCGRHAGTSAPGRSQPQDCRSGGSPKGTAPDAGKLRARNGRHLSYH